MKREIFHYSIRELVPYIDWSYFMHAWRVDKESRQAANELKHDAMSMLKELDGRYHTHAVFALCNARSEEDCIVAEGVTIHLLRQQHSQPGTANICLSDFVSPKEDRIGLFATCVDKGFGAEYSQDTYMNLLAQTLADRLAEATATAVHRAVRTDRLVWGYSPNEKHTIEELLAERNQGIRPAVGYPSLPDQSIIFTINTLLRIEEIGIELTQNGAMSPHASVCGIMLAHPAAHYFNIGKISEEQLMDYSKRRGMHPDTIRKYLSKNLQ